MRKFIIALAATTALAAATPAVAQSVGGNVQVRIGELQTQLQAGVRSGAITRAEAVPLREQLRQLSALERHYRQGGFTVQERSELQSRIASLRQGIRMATTNGGDRYDRRDRDDRWDDRRCPPGLERKDNGCMPPGQVGRDDRNGRWGDDDRRGGTIDRNRDGYDDRDLNRDGRIDAQEWRMARDGRFDDRDDRDGRWGDDDRRGGMIDRNRDGYDDRDLNRDGRIDSNEWRIAGDGRYDRDDDDRYEDRDRRGGVGGVLDGLLGRNSMRVGQRVTADARLGAVPYEYRNQYRDGNGVYYRSDGRSIYQIDAGTHTVLRIYALGR
jgi:hypothetical protein